MKYELRIWEIGHGVCSELTAEQYSSLVGAVRRIQRATDIEEKLDLLLANHFEYEQELLELALRNSLYPELAEHRISSEVQVLNRRTINLLTAARTYGDQLRHAISKYFSSQEPGEDTLSAILSAQYDQHLDYRIAEALRNHVQHRSLPVHVLSWPSRWEEADSSERRLRFSVVPSVSVEQLMEEGGFKASVLAELQESGKERWSLTPILRRYVECLTSVHEEVRALIAGQVAADHQLVLKTRQQGARVELQEALVVLAVDEHDQVRERHSLSLRWWKRREVLAQKNASFPNLSRRYASGEHAGDTS